MLIDTSITIAYKCISCGSFDFFNISLFMLLSKGNCVAPCRCKKSGITIDQEGENSYFITFPCIGCGSEHVINIKKKDMISGRLRAFNCPETGMKICFIGRDDIVRKRVDGLEKEYDEIIDKYGYESYFKNTQVMFDTLNYIHDIALKGKLSCECGSSDADLKLFSDSILLKCGRCGCEKIIPAACNKDLKEIFSLDSLLISEKTSGCSKLLEDNSHHGLRERSTVAGPD